MTIFDPLYVYDKMTYHICFIYHACVLGYSRKYADITVLLINCIENNRFIDTYCK